MPGVAPYERDAFTANAYALASSCSLMCLRIAWFFFRFFMSDGFSKRWFFFTSERIPDFSQVFVNLRKAFSKDSPGLTTTPVMGL
jgi:hypothetical protein